MSSVGPDASQPDPTAGAGPPPVPGASAFPPALAALAAEVALCTRCALAQTRTQVVFGSGSPSAEVMFVGEAPGFHEDKQGLPFVGAAGSLLEELLGLIGLRREDVWICNVLKCRPPENRDPEPAEIDACQSHLHRQIELIQPRVVATLGNFATKLLSGRPEGITQVHGVARDVTLGGRSVTLFPLFHPAAALYTRRLGEVLQADMRTLGELLDPRPATAGVSEVHAGANEVQLGLF